jgi:hypothetical protein
MTQATTQATVASQTIAVEHVKLSSERSFAEVRRRLEGTLPKLDASIAEVLRSGADGIAGFLLQYASLLMADLRHCEISAAERRRTGARVSPPPAAAHENLSRFH